MPVDRRDPERLLIRRQEAALRPKPLLPPRAWPTGGEFVAPPRPRAPPLPVRTPPRLEPPLRFITSSAAARAQGTASALAAQDEAKRPTEPQQPPSSPPHSGKRHPNTLAGKSLKCTVVVSPEDVAAIAVRDGQPRVVLRIEVAGRTLTADISAKSARRAITAVREHGPDGVVAIVQGRLEGAAIADAGLSAQSKTPKPAEPAV